MKVLKNRSKFLSKKVKNVIDMKDESVVIYTRPLRKRQAFRSLKTKQKQRQFK